ncbi:acyl carrier protein [Patescibacteria group bacterium]|nr:acyl carrier protein [Patescibacteria group bacterium]
MQEKLYDILAKILEISREEINDNISPENTPTWDSFNAVMMVAELEKSSGTKFDMADVMAVKNVGDIKKVLDKYKVKYEC